MIAAHGEPEQTAALAADLQRCLKVMTGAELPVVPVSGPAARPGIALATVASLADASRERALPTEPEHYVIRVDDGQRPEVLILGADEAGLAFGVYAFLESLGCRWYVPGPLGEEIPKRDTLVLGEGVRRDGPDFALRNVWWAYGGRPGWQKSAYSLWRTRNRMGGVQAFMGHNLQRIVPSSTFGAGHPEYFPLIDGKRRVPGTAEAHGWQPCTSNPEVVEIAAKAAIEYFTKLPSAFTFSLSPADGYGWCECPDCTAQDPLKFRGMPRRGKGRRMALFANAVAEKVSRELPAKYLCWYAYAGSVEAPEDVKVHPNVIVSLAHYGWCGCNLHDLRDERCALNAEFREVLEGWCATGCKLFIREYWTTLVSATDMPARVCAAYSLADDIPYFRSRGVIGFSSESIPDYGACALNFWMAARKMWDAEADTEGLLTDWFGGMYGPAAAEMCRITEEIVARCRDGGCRGNAFSEEYLKGLQERLETAREACSEERHRGRIDMSVRATAFALQLRDYILGPNREKHQALVAAVADIKERHDFAVDFRSFLSRLGREAKADVKLADPWRELRLRRLPGAPPVPAAALDTAMVVRGQHAFVVVVEAGDVIRGEFHVRRLGAYLSGGAFALVSPSGKVVLTGYGFVNEPVPFEAKAGESGTYVLALTTGSNAARVRIENPLCCLAGKAHHFLGRQPALFAGFATAGDRARTVTLNSDASGDPEKPGETARMQVFGADGEPVADGDTLSGKPFRAHLDSVAGTWVELRVGPASKGVLEDLRISLGGECHPFLATHPGRLMVPSE